MADIKVTVNIDPNGICDKKNICNEMFYSWAVDCVGSICQEQGLVPLREGQLSNGWSNAGHAIQWDAYGSNGYDYAGVQFYHSEFVHPITGSAHWDERIPIGLLTQRVAQIIQ